MAKRRKITVEVTVTFPDWMTVAEAKREVRTLINNQSNYLDHGPDFQDVHEKTIRASKVQRVFRCD